MKKTITVGIPAYNEEVNIVNLLKDLKDQKLSKNYLLRQVIVISDGSKDDTVQEAKKIKWTKLKVVAGRKNKGKASRLNQIARLADGQALVFLDADIRISDRSFLQKLIYPIMNDKADLTSSAIDEIIPRSSFEKALDVSMQLKSNLFNEFKKGCNVYNCHGPARAIDKKLYKKLKFPQDAGDDMYTFLKCIKLGMRFKYIENVCVSYRLPETKKEHLTQSWRFNWSKDYYRKEYSDRFLSDQFKIPLSVTFIAGVKSFPILIKNLNHTFYYIVLWLESLLYKRKLLDIGSTWNVVSTKEVANGSQ
jgi:glycosyltransferase involved in cell wall biosynthesis